MEARLGTHPARGEGSTCIEWAKRHADDEKVADGNISKEDRDGNRLADACADKGADMIGDAEAKFLHSCAARKLM